MNKLLLICLFVVTAFVFSACGPDTVNENSKKDSAQGFEPIYRTYTYNDSLIKTYKPNLDSILIILKDNPKTVAKISGYTDNTASSAELSKKSKQWAFLIADYLKTGGIEESRLFVQGAGPVMPIAKNKTPEGRAKNNRIELIIEVPKPKPNNWRGF